MSSKSSSSSTFSEDEESSASSSEDFKPTTKSLRSGRSANIKAAFKPKIIAAKKKSLLSAAIRCIRTRATRRTKSSPLRELPMYAIKSKKKKKKMILKKKVADKKAKQTKVTKDDSDVDEKSMGLRSRRIKSPKKDR